VSVFDAEKEIEMNWNEKTILLTGGTGSFGQKFTEIMLKKYNPKRIRIFSRDEMKQYNMRQIFGDDRRLGFLIGDVRDSDRLYRAADGVDVIVHAAALKQVPVCEYNPFEAVQTNVVGTENVINAAIDHNIEKVMAIGSDKAVNPVNLYGATKMCMEKIFIAANSYIGASRQTRLSCVRCGNVIASRGSVVSLFLDLKKQGIKEFPITDERMTRFWITLEQEVEFVIKCVDLMKGGEVFIPRVPSMKITDLALSVDPSCRYKKIGIRPGEKINEILITEEESRRASEFKDLFVIESDNPFWKMGHIEGGKPVAEGFRYTSNENPEWLTRKDMEKLLGGIVDKDRTLSPVAL
jgi:UDP-N-acetylglucosamine 4,6-dehydratase/5-epimerase